MADSLSTFKNLGPKSAEWLAEVGIVSIDDLRRVGAVRAYLTVKSARQRASLNLLYSLHATLQDRSWDEVTDDEKAMLKELLVISSESPD